MTHNAPEVLRSSKALHKRAVFAQRSAANLSGRFVRDVIREEIPPPRGNGNFPGYAAKGTLRSAVAYTEPKKYPGGFTVDVVMKPNASKVYQRIHEVGGVIRAKPDNRAGGYLVFRIMGRWVKVRQVRIKRKRYFSNGWKRAIGMLPEKFARYYEKELRVR